MYICGICKKHRPEKESPERVVIERREKVYPFRAKVNKVKGDFWKDDKGGTGWEIAKEVDACPSCAKEANSASAA